MYRDKSPVFVQPKVYPAHEHKISPEQIDEHARYVIEKLRTAGYKAYLVGGGVRDLLLKQRPKDFDISTSAKPEEVRALFRNAILIGRRFRLAHVRFGKKIIEVSTFRAGDPGTADLIVRDNVWGNEEEDVLRRDFTINGLFYDPQSQTVIDYVDGYLDLEKRVLRTIGQPHLRFSQDPVRMIRLIKFCARFRFDIDKPTFEALLNCKNEILKSSSARILEELLRMLESGSAKTFFHLLHEYGLLRPLLPGVADYFDKSPDNEILALLCELDADVRKGSIDRSVLLSTLLFPLLRHRLLLRAQKSDRPFHLALIQEEALRAIDEAFSTFFLLPRRLRGMAAFVLTAQFRIQPLDDKPVRTLRAPRDPLFPLALKLFKIRAAIQPDLLPYHTRWTEAGFAEQTVPLQEIHPHRRRRRRRRGRPHETHDSP
ncbi:MAG: polynucleotide adenylyltransferase PcnB [Verrucomicrobiota bacterium]|nr:polynucleotide adenylyltransferase PcnB [Verrucomicrobiota bacterium]